MQNDNKWNLTEDQMNALTAMNEAGCTDSDVCRYCEQNDVSLREADAFISELNAPEECKGCKHVTTLSMCFPCNVCSRMKKDSIAPLAISCHHEAFSGLSAIIFWIVARSEERRVGKECYS